MSQEPLVDSKESSTSRTRTSGSSSENESDDSFKTRLDPDYPYLSLTESDREAILDSLGCDSYDDLEADVPQSLKTEFTPSSDARTEESVYTWHQQNSARNRTTDDLTCFLGGGLYDHYVPSTVTNLLGRTEFLTSYTPYQSEINQGTLQAMFEFQSMISELTQLPVTNASMYDGATAFAEACLMAINVTRRDTIYYSPNLYDSWIGTLKSYAKPHGWTLRELPSNNGVARLPNSWEEEPAAVALGYPNKFGLADSVTEWSEARPDDEAVGIAGINPLAMGLLTPPGDLGMDVAVGEGQPLGLPLQGGAPQLGLFSAAERFVRRMPGRLVGETQDRRGNRSYVLTLQTREQHIRRERATSNICTNHALLTIGVSIALATFGPDGIRRRAHLNHRQGQSLKSALSEQGLNVLGNPIFNEVTVEADSADSQVNSILSDNGMMGGFWSDNRYICAATERRSDEEIEAFAREVAKALE
ncbi:MAG: aminomethyl-transferring glycine dehydrogenase subunit GcvPA [bacterium]